MFVKDSLTVHGRDTTSIMYQCTIMGTYMPKNVYIPVLLFVFITCSCNLKSSAMKEGFEFGKKLPLVPFMLLDKFGLQMCFRECEAYGACLSINYNRRHLVCELNNGWKNSTLSLINDGDYVYKEILRPVSFFLFRIFFWAAANFFLGGGDFSGTVLNFDLIQLQFQYNFWPHFRHNSLSKKF